MVEYIARFEPSAAGDAEREFMLRSIRELRLWRTVLLPVFFLAVLIIFYAIPAPTWTRIEILIFFILSISEPVLFYFVRPVVAARWARKMPTRVVRLTPESFEMQMGARRMRVPWRRFRKIWIARDYMYLIINAYMSIKLPRAGMPDEARNFIAKSIERQA